ncbi:hypothetical protein ACUOI6_22565, partial [Escherichia coli]
HQPNRRLRLAAEPQTGRREVSALTDARKTLAYDFFRILRAPQEAKHQRGQFPASSPKWDTLSECDCRTQNRAYCTIHALFNEVTEWAVGFIIPFTHPGFS